MTVTRSESFSRSWFASACSGKQGFPSFAAADRAVKNRKIRVVLGKLVAYRCPHCREWHLGRSAA